MLPGLRAVLTPLIMLAVVALLGAACDGDDDGGVDFRFATEPPSTASSPLPDIRTIDLAANADVQALGQRLGGQVAMQDVVYADLTNDGLDDAVVPVSSGGTEGVLGFLVIGYLNDQLRTLMTEAPGTSLRVGVSDGLLKESLPVYRQDDRPGFPSQIRNVYYAWRGERFIVDHEETVDNPNLPRE